MSNGEKWYKDPNNIVRLLIIGIVVAIIGTTWSFLLNPPQSDFIISIYPMTGTIEQGGTVFFEAKIDNINKIVALFNPYNYPVKLSISEPRPTGIVVTLTPFGESTLPYNSTVIINVRDNVPSGEYRIIINGKGSDGKEHSTEYTLIVSQIVTLTPSPKPTHTPTPTPIPPGIVNIPLSAGWQVDSSESGGGGVEYKNGILELKTKLQGNNVAQFSLDLRGMYIPEIERNSDGTYNLSGTELIAVVKSNRNFEGRLALFDKSWNFLNGSWLDRIDATNGQMVFKVPDDINYSKINAISIVFAIQPNETYEGSFFVQSLTLKK